MNAFEEKTAFEILYKKKHNIFHLHIYHHSTYVNN